jgi:hypothetical protein
MLRSILRLVLIVSIAIVGGCATKIAPPYVKVDREAPTSVADTDAAVIILNTIVFCEFGKSCREKERPRVGTSKIERCLSKTIPEHLPKLKLIPAKEFWAVASPGVPFADSMRAPATILETLANADTWQRLQDKLSLRYVIVLDVNITDTKTDTELLGSRYSAGWRQDWLRSLSVITTVFDARSAQRVGSLNSSTSAVMGYIAELVFMIPLVASTGHEPTESESCDALGRGVADFIEGKT